MTETIVWACAGTNVKGDPCGSKFRSAENPEWCTRHDPSKADYWREASKRGGRGRTRIRSTCALDGCSKSLPKGRARWCSDEHSSLGTQRAKTERARLEAGEPVASQIREGSPAWYDDDCHLLLDDPGRPTPEDISEQAAFYGVDKSTITRWYNGERQKRVEAKRRSGWSEPVRAYPEKWRDLTLDDVPALYADFVWFRGEIFETEDEEPYLIADFHENWILSFLRTCVTRGRLMILSPPRHGKTDLLSHLVIWLICRFPNIRIIWIGPNDEVAQDIVGQAILEHFEDNPKLADMFCPPGVTFKPKGKGRSWTKAGFTVATRTVFGIKSPSAKFQGRGGTLVSRDADVIICDDIEQDKTVFQPGTREKTRNWASTSLFSRKTKKTAIAFIGSRQHPDDLWQHFLDNPMFETVVEVAHDPNCEIVQNDPELYPEHVDCMLWPVVNDFEWLMEMQTINDDLGGRDTFEMVYLNRVTGLGMTVFEAVDVAACKNKNYRIGHMPTPIRTGDVEPGGIRLIGGLDPSGSGYQAAFCWAVQVVPELRMWMFDIENQEGGGISQARKIIEAWHEKWGISHWVVEENLYHHGIMKDEGVVALRQKLGIVMEATWTGDNKWDPYMGVSTLKPLFVKKQIILPYGDLDSIAKSDQYQRQLVNFSNAPRNRNTTGGYKSDLVMASWFPMQTIRRWKSEFSAEMGVDMSDMPFIPDDWDTTPWDDWEQPVWAS